MVEQPVFPKDPATLVAFLAARTEGRLPGLLGIEIVELSPGHSRLALEIDQRHEAPNGYLHAGSLITLADTACGFGCVATLPDGATGFTTLEISSNHVGTALQGRLEAVAQPMHLGRTTQVWDATVTVEPEGRRLALFRCTQMVLYPR
ncbi:MAG TPA: PaaI family thioesterase [Acidimicrobiia bacterium]|nr:PaaI family thioesterase [Acidimicrobiia bacterium]